MHGASSTTPKGYSSPSGWEAGQVAAGGICVQPPWSSPALGLTSLPPAPSAAPSCSQSVSQITYARYLYKQNCTTPLSVFFVGFFYGGGVVYLFCFLSSSFLSWLDDFSDALEFLFLLCVYIYDNRLLVCCDHEILIQQSVYTCVIVLSCWSLPFQCISNILHVYSPPLTITGFDIMFECVHGFLLLLYVCRYWWALPFDPFLVSRCGLFFSA